MRSHPTIIAYAGTDRITALKEKLDQIQTTMATQKATQFEKTKARLAVLDEKVRSAVESRAHLLGSMGSDVSLVFRLEETARIHIYTDQ